MKKLFSIMFLLAFTLSSFVSLANADVTNNDFLNEKELIQKVETSNDVLTIQSSDEFSLDYSHCFVATYEPIHIVIKSVNLQPTEYRPINYGVPNQYKNRFIRPPNNNRCRS